MPQHDEHAPLKRLDERLRRQRELEEEKQGRIRRRYDPRSGLSIALRIGVEIVAALAVGAGIGILLDRWLGTAPWLLMVFFVLGAAAGMVNVYRVMAGMDQAVGYRRGKDEGKNQRKPDN